MTATTFVITPATGGFQVFANTSGDWGNGSGLATEVTFKTEADAQAWVGEQFGVPASAWVRNGATLTTQR